MKFLIQKIDKEIRHDFSFQLLETLRFRKWIDPTTKDIVKYLNYDPTIQPNPNDYQSVLESLAVPFKESHRGYVPIGSVEFVTKFLQHFYGLMPSPKNVPDELTDYRFTKRSVWTCGNGAFSAFKNGKYFVKSTTGIKKFAEIVTKKDGNFDCEFPEDIYQVSTYISIDSEWRAFVYEGKLVGLQNYSGDFTVFPDIGAIKNMIEAYESAPIAYTLDVGVNNIHTYFADIGTFLIEVHDFFSCGLYGFNQPVLANMFYRWFNEYLKNNMGTTTYGTNKSKFKKNKKYRSLCSIFTPNGIVMPGQVYTGKEWEKILVFEVGLDFDVIFELINKEK